MTLLHYFFDLTSIVGVLEDLKTPKGHFEINWSLMILFNQIIFSIICFRKLTHLFVIDLLQEFDDIKVKQACCSGVISLPYLNQEGEITPTTLLLAPLDFQTFLRPCKVCRLLDINWLWRVPIVPSVSATPVKY